MVRVISTSYRLSGRAPRRVFLWIGFGLFLIAGNVWGESNFEIEEDLSAPHVQYMDRFWSSLETSEYAQLRTASAIRLLRTEEPLAIERGTRLINAVLSKPSPNPASLWLLASDCYFRKFAAWCGPDGVYEMLSQADQGNAAVLILGLNLSNQVKDETLLDSDFNRHLLLKAAVAERFDMYWGRDADKLYEEALKFVETNPVPPVPSSYFADLRPHAYAFTITMGLVVTAGPTLGFSNIVNLCRLQGQMQHLESINSCKKLARTMVENGGTFLTRSIGNAIERVTLQTMNPDDPRIPKLQLRKEALEVVRHCLSPLWVHDIDRWLDIDKSTMMDFAKNLSEQGEWKGYRLSAMQEYDARPEIFLVNPADCDGLLELDDKALETLINGQSAYEVWQAMQTEASAQKRE